MNPTPTLVTLSEIEEAARHLPAEIVRTPLLTSLDLGHQVGVPTFLKPECLQVTGSYKSRAAFTVLSRLSPEQRARGAAISSSGNFAGAWAFMGRLLGIPVAVVMTESTSPFKIERTRAYGAEVILCPPDFDARWSTLNALERDRGMTVINTFEHADVIRGHGTIGWEIGQDLKEVGTVLVPASSGGLLAGVAVAVKALHPQARVIGVQPEGSQAVYTSFKQGSVTRVPKVETICDALVAAFPGNLPFHHLQQYVDDVVTVPEADVRRAVKWLAENAKLVVEAGGAVGVAALRTGAVQAVGPTIALLSGGNILPQTLASYLSES